VVLTGLAVALAGSGEVAGPRPDGTAITPIGWRVTPAGRQVLLQDGAVYADRPYGVVESPNGLQLVISNDGRSTQSLMVVDSGSAMATPLTAPFSSPNLTPYTAAVPAAIGEVNTVISAMAKQSAKMDFSRADAAPEDLLNKAIWQSVKGRNSTPSRG
jgi:hypothetical protein